jgi:hypothetical protein
MKNYGGGGDIAVPFLTSTLDVGEWSALPPGKEFPRTQCMVGRAGPRAGLDAVQERKLSRSCRNNIVSAVIKIQSNIIRKH